MRHADRRRELLPVADEPGLSAEVAIVTAQRLNVLNVPATALIRVGKDRACLVKADGAYYEADENGQPRGDPYCTRCWEVERKVVTIYEITERLMRGMSRCPECKATPRWPGRK